MGDEYPSTRLDGELCYFFIFFFFFEDPQALLGPYLTAPKIEPWHVRRVSIVLGGSAVPVFWNSSKPASRWTYSKGALTASRTLWQA